MFTKNVRVEFICGRQISGKSTCNAPTRASKCSGGEGFYFYISLPVLCLTQAIILIHVDSVMISDFACAFYYNTINYTILYVFAEKKQQRLDVNELTSIQRVCWVICWLTC